ncbi:LysR family transcriptional regulator [Noviherbaspirillum saxi]|uniref:LysR family transcriptional regulator n=1 Tax=Noviherbaspirillum saxi TaxID=2320863 RepID=A0A3A3FJZ7_9BURK|nr:LysR family transcriptional regulator [Noviherbaspirillum saxi]RJF91802.1 LysR family transcriptional regulator [Noviherbaspirillum saxi]
MVNYTLRQLKYFLTTVECGSVAEASRRLYIAQPSVSSAIKSLEDNFGIQLFIRHHAQGVTLTPAGMRFHHKAQELLRVLREFEQNALADNDVVSGQIDIGCFKTLGPVYLPRLIADFSRAYPGVKLNIKDGDQSDMKNCLQSGQLDLAILYNQEIDESVFDNSVLLDELRPYVILSADHPLAGRDSVSLHELSTEPMILLDLLPSKTYFLSIFRDYNLAPHIAFRSPSLELVRGLVGRGLGFSVMVTRPEIDVTYDGNHIVCMKIKESVDSVSLTAIWLKSNQLTRPAQLFVDLCRKTLNRHGMENTDKIINIGF